MKKQLLLIVLLLAGGVAGAIAVLNTHPAAAHASHDHHEPHDAAESVDTGPAEGPHGGKLLRGDGFEIEVTIFENDVAPEFRLFGYRLGQPIPPAELAVTLELHRLDKKDLFTFSPREDYLLGNGVVHEPHSFDVVVRASHAGKTAEWTYASYEGRVTIAPEHAKAAGVQVAQAGPATIQETVTLHGVIIADANRVARVGARFPGIVKAVRKQLGEAVAEGEVLAVVESNESLQSYEIKAPQAGLVTERAASVGAVTGEAPLFVLTDLSTVLVELHAFAADARKLTVGLHARVHSSDGAVSAGIVLPSFLPFATGGSQTRILRVPLDNRDGRWSPGLRVLATVQLPPQQVPLGVRTTGLQSFRDFTVVFAQVGDTYEVRMLELGRTDGEMIEVLGGLEPGERYVTAGSFLIKADVMKSGASHEH